MSDRRRNLSTGSDGQALTCVICLGAPKFPTGRPESCKHVFCFLCINNWVKRRSECPLCKSRTKFIIKTAADGKETKIKVRQRTEAQFSHELATADEQYGSQDEIDITVAFAQCRVCHRSDNPDRLLLCDGRVGQEFNGAPIHCNAAYHCYCLPEPLAEVPHGRWYCPFCVDLRETQRGVYNRRYAAPRKSRARSQVPIIDLVDDDQPGPSRGRFHLRSRRRIVVDDNESFSEEISSSEETYDSEENSSELGLNSLEDDEESEPSFTQESDSRETNDEKDWENIDRYVLTNPDVDYVPKGPTTTVRRRKSAKRKKSTKPKARKNKTSTPTRKRASKKTEGVPQKKKRRTRKSVTRGQRRLASAIGINPETGEMEKKQKKDRYPADGIRRGKFGAPVLSLLGNDYDDLPVPDEESASVSKPVPTSQPFLSSTQQQRNGGDLVGSIMFEQTKTLAPARFQKVGRDGKIHETEMMTEHRKRVNQKIAGNHAFAPPRKSNPSK